MGLWRTLYPRTLVPILMVGLVCLLTAPRAVAAAPVTLTQAPSATIAYAGSHSGLYNAFALEVSEDWSTVVSISATILPCGASNWSFTVPLSPTLPIAGSHFSARAVAVPSIAGAKLDIDGVFFDADGDNIPEQAVGGLSFVTPPGVRCNVQWWATDTLDTDHDGWSDAAERRLGSDSHRPQCLPPLPGHPLRRWTRARCSPFCSVCWQYWRPSAR